MKFDLVGIGMTSQRTRDRLVDRLKQEGIQDERVLEVIRSTPRHIFVDEALASRAYEDTALPIGFSQTISQPYIVARMTELLLQNQPKKVLEVGTGSGYQTAVLSQLVERVFSVERIRPLMEYALERLQAMSLHNIVCKHSDGSWGWPEQAPYDAIIVTAAPEQIPAELVQQLADGGQLIIPSGPDNDQRLCVIQRHGDEFEEFHYERVSFVPLIRGQLA